MSLPTNKGPLVLSLSKDTHWAGLPLGLRQAQAERMLAGWATGNVHTVHPGNFALHSSVFFSIHAWQLPLAR